MAPRRKNKRSLEDMVRKLSEEKQLEAEMNTARHTLPLPLPINNMMFPPPILSPMTRFMHPTIAPMLPNMYFNNFLRSPFTYYLPNLGLSQFPTTDFRQTELNSSDDGIQTPEEDIKIDVSSGDLEATPSPSSVMGDITYGASENIRDKTRNIGGNENDADKPYACQHIDCYKRFSSKILLKKHIFIHTGLQPHQCPHCNRKFNRKDNLIRHNKSHHQNGETVTSKPKTPGNVINEDIAPFTMNNIGIDNFRFHLENNFQLARLTNPTFFIKTEETR